MEREVRLERLHPVELRAAMAEAPIAWVPLGALEFHAQHLPFGTDGFSAQQVVERAARIAGGVVLPWSALTIGTLHLEWTFRYDAAIVEAALRQTLLQLADHGTRVVIVHTGHGPLDLAHLIKRVCADVEASDATADDFRAYGLCYLELNAANGVGLGSDWPVAVDHGSIVETSWVMAMEPDLVHLDRLPEATDSSPILGVYGPNPRELASEAMGRDQLDGCAQLLAERAGRLLEGQSIDTMADLRGFVECYWPEELRIGGRAGADGSAALTITNPAPVSRYLTSVDVMIDGEPVAASDTNLLNETPGESSIGLRGDELGPESGLYVRRDQSATLRLPDAIPVGPHEVELGLGLAGVTTRRFTATVEFE